MATLSRDQISTLLTNAGFPAGTIHDTMIGIAFAESGGNPNSHNSTPPDDSYGLWQINMLGSLGPARRKQFGISTNSQLFDPATNARAALIIYKGSGLKAWSTYNNGAYKKFMNGTATTVSADIGNPVTGVASALSSGVFSGITSAIDAAGQNIFKGVADFTGIILALTLLVTGIIVLVVDSKGVRNTAKGAVKLAAVVK
jgi:hypothetical protein